jgi:hypothetical protein
MSESWGIRSIGGQGSKLSDGESYGAPMMRTALLISGLALAAALTVAWDSFIGYEFFRFFELVL